MGRLKSWMKKYLKLLLIYGIIQESHNIGCDTLNIITNPKERIENITTEVTKVEEEALGIKFQTKPKIITSCHGNILYRITNLGKIGWSKNYLKIPVLIAVLPVYPPSNTLVMGEYHQKNDCIFINGGYTVFEGDVSLKGTVAHEMGHKYVRQRIDPNCISEKLDEGIAEYMTAKTLHHLGHKFKPSYKREYEYTEELIKIKGYKSIDELIEGECKK